MTDTHTCTLCGQGAHLEPVPAPYGLWCPGDSAPEENRALFSRQLAEARQVAHLLAGLPLAEEMASDSHIRTAILRRTQAGHDRLEQENPAQRAPVSHEQLVADCDARVAEIAPGIVARAKLAVPDWEPPAHLVVPGKVPESPALSTVAAARLAETSDYALFLGTAEGGR